MMSDSLTYTLGIEGGATRTSIILADCSDNVITQFTAGPCNLRLMSKDQLETHLVSIRERLPKIPDAIGIGLAGVRQQADLEVLITTVGRVWPSQQTGVLTTNGINDPYHPETSGFFPGEAGAAVVLTSESVKESPKLTGYWCNSDADSPIGMPSDGKGLSECLKKAVNDLELRTDKKVKAVCPHASGTLLHAQAEQAALINALRPEDAISLHPLKPFTGHSVGASGLLDTAILAHYMRNHQFPPNLPNLTSIEDPFLLPNEPVFALNSTLLKISVGMGGHNSVVSLEV